MPYRHCRMRPRQAAPKPERLHRMGERVAAGSLVYNVFEDQWKTKLGKAPTRVYPKTGFSSFASAW